MVGILVPAGSFADPGDVHNGNEFVEALGWPHGSPGAIREVWADNKNVNGSRAAIVISWPRVKLGALPVARSAPGTMTARHATWQDSRGEGTYEDLFKDISIDNYNGNSNITCARCTGWGHKRTRRGAPILDFCPGRCRGSDLPRGDERKGRRTAGDHRCAGADGAAAYAKGPSRLFAILRRPPGAHAQLPAALRGASFEDQAHGFMAQYASAFGIHSPKTEFQTKRQQSENGRNYVRMEQFYGSLQVFGAEAIVQLDDNGGVACVVSDLMTNTWPLDTDKVPVTPKIGAEEAKELALAHFQPILDKDILSQIESIRRAEAEGYITANWAEASVTRANQVGLTAQPDSSLVVYDPAVVGLTGAPSVTWKIKINSSDLSTLGIECFVDVTTGQTRFYHSLIQSAMKRELWDTNFIQSRTPGAYIWPWFWIRVELERTEARTNDLTIFDDPDYLFMNDNWRGLKQAYDYFSSAHGWRYEEHYLELDGNNQRTIPGTIRSYMYWYKDIFDSRGAQWSGGPDPIMSFGIWGVDVADDMIGHEYTHGVTQDTSGLIGFGEPGALNESMSDIFGEFIDLTTTGGWAFDPVEHRWLIAETVPLGAIRNMKDPPWVPNPVWHLIRGPHPEIYMGQFWQPVSDPSDNGGVHKNAGVGNKLCYIMTEGDTFNGYTIAAMHPNFFTSIGIVEDLYWEVQSHLLTSNADYHDLGSALAQAGLNFPLKPGQLPLTAGQLQTIDDATHAVEIAGGG